MARVTGGVFACGVLVLLGCHGRGSKSQDPCANGACDNIQTCELGLCEEDPLLEKAQTVATHSPNAGTFREGEQANCPYAESELPPMEELIDDSKIPEFERGRGRRSNMNAGRAFLQDHELHEHLLGVQGALFTCLDMAACYQEQPVVRGALDFDFELEPDGHVSAVSVAPSEELNNPVVLACARKSLYEFRFPSWNGGRMIVSYSIEFSEA